MERGNDIRFIQKLLGSSELKTILIYTYLSKKSLTNIASPIDAIFKHNKLINNDLTNDDVYPYKCNFTFTGMLCENAIGNKYN